MHYVWELISVALSLSLSEPYAFETDNGVCMVWHLAVVGVFIYTRDGGALPYLVNGIRDREPDSYHIDR